MHLSNSSSFIKAILLEKCESLIDALISHADSDDSMRGVEASIWAALMALGNVITALLFARRCERSMAADLQARGLQRHEVQVLANPNHQVTITTTLGRVRFPVRLP